jgi:hypothetical protein
MDPIIESDSRKTLSAQNSTHSGHLQTLISTYGPVRTMTPALGQGHHCRRIWSSFPVSPYLLTEIRTSDYQSFQTTISCTSNSEQYTHFYLTSFGFISSGRLPIFIVFYCVLTVFFVLFILRVVSLC